MLKAQASWDGGKGPTLSLQTRRTDLPNVAALGAQPPWLAPPASRAGVESCLFSWLLSSAHCLPNTSSVPLHQCLSASEGKQRQAFHSHST